MTPKVSRTPTRLDLLDDRGGLPEQRVALAFFLQRNCLAQQIEGRALFGVDVILEEFVGALMDMRVHSATG
jgi:hypothetical protein